MRDDALCIEALNTAQSVAGGAGAERAVEREQPWFEFGQRAAAGRTGKARRERVLDAGIGFKRDGAALAVPQRGFEGRRRSHAQAIDQHVDRVTRMACEAGRRIQIDELAVQTHPGEALRAQGFEDIVALALAGRYQRRQDGQPRFLGQCERRVDHLRDRLCSQRQPVLGTVGQAGTRVQQAQVVVDLGHRAHGGARIVAGAFLLDRDRRRQALDEIDVGLLHQVQELAGVGREGFDVAPLAFGVERVEGERAFSRA